MEHHNLQCIIVIFWILTISVLGVDTNTAILKPQTQHSSHVTTPFLESNQTALTSQETLPHTVPITTKTTNSIIANESSTLISTTYQPISSTVVNNEDYSGSGDDPDNEYITETTTRAKDTTTKVHTSTTSLTQTTTSKPKSSTMSKSTSPAITFTWTEITTTMSPISTKYTTIASSTKFKTQAPTSESFTTSGEEDFGISGEDMFTTARVDKTTKTIHTISTQFSTQKATSTITPYKSTTSSVDTTSEDMFSGSGDKNLFSTVFPISEDTTQTIADEITQTMFPPTQDSSGEVTLSGDEKSGEEFEEITTPSISFTTNVKIETASREFSAETDTTTSSVVLETGSGEFSGELETTATSVVIETGSGEIDTTTESAVKDYTSSVGFTGRIETTSTPVVVETGSIEFTEEMDTMTTSPLAVTGSGEFSGEIDTTTESTVKETVSVEFSGEVETTVAPVDIETGSGEFSGDIDTTTASVVIETGSGEFSGEIDTTTPDTNGETISGESSGEEMFTISSSVFPLSTTYGPVVETASGEEETTIDLITTAQSIQTTPTQDLNETASGETSGEEFITYSSVRGIETTPDSFTETASGELSGEVDITTSFTDNVDTTAYTDTTQYMDVLTTVSLEQGKTTAEAPATETTVVMTKFSDIPSTVIGETTTDIENVSDENLFTTEKQTTTVEKTTLRSEVTTKDYLGETTFETKTPVFTELTSVLPGAVETTNTRGTSLGQTTSVIELSTNVVEVATTSSEEKTSPTITVPVTTEAVVQTTNALEITTVDQGIVETTLVRDIATTSVFASSAPSAETTTVSKPDILTKATITQTTGQEQVKTTESSMATTPIVSKEQSMSASTAATTGTDVEQMTSSVLTSTSPAATISTTTEQTTSSMLKTTTTSFLPGVTIQGDIRIVGGLNYSTELINISSPMYTTTRNDIANLITVIYRESSLKKDFGTVNEISFRQGSVLVTYFVVFKQGANVSASDVQDPFMKATKNGTVLGKYSLDPNYGGFTVITSPTTISTTSTIPSTPVPRAAVIQYKIPSWAIGVILALAILLVFFLLFCIIWCCCQTKKETQYYTVPGSNSSYTDSLMGEFTLTNKQDFQLQGAYNSIEKDKKALSETIGGSTRGSLNDRSISIPRRVRVPLGSMNGGRGRGGEVNLAATGDEGYMVEKTSPSASAASTVVATSRDNFIDEIDFDFKDFFIVQVDDGDEKNDFPNILDANYPNNETSGIQPNATPADFHHGWEPVGDNGVRVFNYTDDAETYYDEVLQIWNTKL